MMMMMRWQWISNGDHDVSMIEGDFLSNVDEALNTCNHFGLYVSYKRHVEV